MNVRLPDGIGGNYYILVYTDAVPPPGPRPRPGPNDLEYLYVTAGMNMVPQFQGGGHNIDRRLHAGDLDHSAGFASYRS